MPDLAGADGAILLPDPVTFPTDAVLRFLTESAPMLPLLGGLASGRTLDDETALFLGDEVVSDGAVGVRFDGVEMLPCVSQGAAPIGPELTITAAEGHVIDELAGKPALEKLRETIEALPPEDLRLVQGGLLVGIVVDASKPDYVQGDFLVRGLVGADPETGQVAVAADVHPGQVVRLHARDAESADRDLREALSIRMTALGGRPPGGRAGLRLQRPRARACSARADHDAEALADALAGAPAAGFFAAGEIGPVGGEYFLHGFTATVAVFALKLCRTWRTVLLTGRDGRPRPGDRARAAPRAAPSLMLTGRRAEVLEPLARGARRARDRVRPRRSATRPSGCSPRPATSTCSSPTPALPGSGRLNSFTVEQIDRALDVNLRAPMLLAHGLTEPMVARGSGHLVFMSSLSGKAAAPGTSVYAATKFGLRGFALGLREDLRAQGRRRLRASSPASSATRACSPTPAPSSRRASAPSARRTSRARSCKAIERNRAEIDVAPLPLRAGAWSLARARPAGAVQRRLGAPSTAAPFERGQTDKR